MTEQLITRYEQTQKTTIMYYHPSDKATEPQFKVQQACFIMNRVKYNEMSFMVVATFRTIWLFQEPVHEDNAMILLKLANDQKTYTLNIDSVKDFFGAGADTSGIHPEEQENPVSFLSDKYPGKYFWQPLEHNDDFEGTVELNYPGLTQLTWAAAEVHRRQAMTKDEQDRERYDQVDAIKRQAPRENVERQASADRQEKSRGSGSVFTINTKQAPVVWNRPQLASAAPAEVQPKQGIIERDRKQYLRDSSQTPQEIQPRTGTIYQREGPKEVQPKKSEFGAREVTPKQKEFVVQEVEPKQKELRPREVEPTQKELRSREVPPKQRDLQTRELTPKQQTLSLKVEEDIPIRIDDSLSEPSEEQLAAAPKTEADMRETLKKVRRGYKSVVLIPVGAIDEDFLEFKVKQRYHDFQLKMQDGCFVVELRQDFKWFVEEMKLFGVPFVSREPSK